MSRKLTPKENVSFEPTEAETAKVISAIEGKNANYGNRPRVKQNSGNPKPNNPNRSPDELVENKVANGDLVHIPLPMPELPTFNTAIVYEPDESRSIIHTYVDPAQAKLTAAQLKAIDLLTNAVDRKSPQEVADTLGLSLSTIYSWINNLVFLTALEEKRRATFYNIGRFKLMNVYDRELDKAAPGSRVLEQVAKTLGFFSDSDSVNVQVNVGIHPSQNDLETDL